MATEATATATATAVVTDDEGRQPQTASATTAAAAGEPGSVVNSDWFTGIHADERDRSVAHRGRPVWKSGGQAPLGVDEEAFLREWGLERTVESLVARTRVRRRITGTKGINEEMLVNLVGDVGGNQAWAKRVARIANLDLPDVDSAQGEVFFQQHVFPPVSGLLHAFDPTLYKADQKVWSGYNCRWTSFDKRTSSAKTVEDGEFFCRPDAALCASARGPSLVLGVMELKGSQNSPDQDDLFNCAVLTCITAVALVQSGVADRVAVPFVVNVGRYAYLYVTTMEKYGTPAVTLLYSANLCDNEERIRFIAILAALLHHMRKLVVGSEGKRILRPLGQKAVESSARDNESKSTQSRTSKSSLQRINETPEAEDVAGAGNQVAGLSPLLVGHHCGSPFYFVGRRSDGGGQVFAKIWRQGDGGTSRQGVRSETELLQLARRGGVPCPEVVPELTALSVEHNGATYHRLVMGRLADDPVGPGDLEAYAASLIEAVRKLHRAGILHCDVKPSNVVWDAEARQASLVDFGHAQREARAVAYTGTDGYTAPEVQRGEAPHSRLSEAYSVGKAILRTARRAAGGGGGANSRRASDAESPACRVAEALSRDDPGARLTLDQAIAEVRPPPPPPPPLSRARPETAPPSGLGKASAGSAAAVVSPRPASCEGLPGPSEVRPPVLPHPGERFPRSIPF
jgi:hypothetical protein